jgi:photosynthetic reaction center H subunit
MGKGAITEYIDVASLAINLFVLFFIGLVAYLHRESKREGYPLVDADHRPISNGLFGMPSPKTYALADGTSMSAPHGRDSQPFAFPDGTGLGSAAFGAQVRGAPLASGVGPGAITARRDVPDVTFDGKDRIVPMRKVAHFHVAAQDLNPVGAVVYGADGEGAGTVKDLWVDLSETVIRYYEIELEGSAKRVLVPANMIDIKKPSNVTEGALVVDAILGSQFAGVPALANPDRITLHEEEKIMGYYGAGYLYATPGRQEPFI